MWCGWSSHGDGTRYWGWNLTLLLTFRACSKPQTFTIWLLSGICRWTLKIRTIRHFISKICDLSVIVNEPEGLWKRSTCKFDFKWHGFRTRRHIWISLNRLHRLRVYTCASQPSPRFVNLLTSSIIPARSLTCTRSIGIFNAENTKYSNRYSSYDHRISWTCLEATLTCA